MARVLGSGRDRYRGLALVAAGVAAGVFSTVVGLASVVSYPALLAIGLPPLSANMTNTVSLLFTGVGAAMGSRPELTGQVARVRRLGTIAALGGGAGAALLLITPPQTFVRLAPVLIGAPRWPCSARPGRTAQPAAAPGGTVTSAAAAPGRTVTGPAAAPGRHRDPSAARGCWPAYSAWRSTSGTSGRPGGIVMLALLIAMVAEPLARVNAVKNMLGAIGERGRRGRLRRVRAR